MDIIDLYEAANARGLARSLRHFSQEFLGRKPNYASETRLVRCSADAVLNLCRRLGELGHGDLQALALERLLDAGTRDIGAGAARP